MTSGAMQQIQPARPLMPPPNSQHFTIQNVLAEISDGVSRVNELVSQLENQLSPYRISRPEEVPCCAPKPQNCAPLVEAGLELSARVSVLCARLVGIRESLAL